MRYLIIIVCLLTPSFGFSHMSTTDLEFDRHGVSYGQVLTKSMVEVVPVNTTLVFVPAMDNDNLYLVLDGCVSADPSCPPRLTELAHDLIFTFQGCEQKHEYLGFKVVSWWNNALQTTVYSYSFVHRYYKNNGWLSSTVTIDSDNVTNYHLYIQNFTYVTNLLNWSYDQVLTGQSSVASLHIDKYLGFLDYEYFKPWYSDFTFDEYRDAIGSDKYYINADIPGLPGCYWSYYIETFFIVPTCQDKDKWQLKLCKRQDDGSLWCASQSNITWKFYGRPFFTGVSYVFIKDLYQGQLAKSDFIQDETVYTSSDPLYCDTPGEFCIYQGFSYWFAKATYQSNAYILKMYGSDPPCSGVFSEGQGKLDTGKGSMFRGSGFRSTAAGGYEEPKH